MKLNMCKCEAPFHRSKTNGTCQYSASQGDFCQNHQYFQSFIDKGYTKQDLGKLTLRKCTGCAKTLALEPGDVSKQCQACLSSKAERLCGVINARNGLNCKKRRAKTSSHFCAKHCYLDRYLPDYPVDQIRTFTAICHRCQKIHPGTTENCPDCPTCPAFNLKGEPCPFNVVEGTKTCKIHYHLEEQQLLPVRWCACCRRNRSTTCFTAGFNSCSFCRGECAKKRRQHVRQQQIAKLGICQAIVADTGKQCASLALPGLTYCKKHLETTSKRELEESLGVVFCKSHFSCNNIIPKQNSTGRHEISQVCEQCRFKWKWGNYNKSAKRRNLDFELNEETLYQLLVKDCIYCGQNSKHKCNTIDRIDSALGYQDTNVVPCCDYCNVMKSTYSVGDWLKQCEHIIEYQKTKKRLYPELFQENVKTPGFVEYTHKATEKRKIAFTLTNEQYLAVKQLPCTYCGLTGNIGIDRKNSAKSYTKGNVQPCCKTCNNLKSTQSERVFLERCRKICCRAELIKQIVEKVQAIGALEFYQKQHQDSLKALPEIENELHQLYLELTSTERKFRKEDIFFSRYNHPDHYYRNQIYNPQTIEELLQLEPELVFCPLGGSNEKDIWNYLRENISSLFRVNRADAPARQLYILVRDKKSQKYLGVLQLRSCPDLDAVNKFIGWERTGTTRQNVMNIATCVPVQPFGTNCLGGKLLAQLCFSREMAKEFASRYGNRDSGRELLGLMTTSLYGKSIQYDRLKCLKYLGLTKGMTTRNINNELYHLSKRYLLLRGELEPNKPCSKLKIVRQTLSNLGLNRNILLDMPRGVYYGPLYPNSQEMLNGAPIQVDHSKLKTVEEITKEWFPKALKRFISRGRHRLRALQFSTDNIDKTLEMIDQKRELAQGPPLAVAVAVATTHPPTPNEPNASTTGIASTFSSIPPPPTPPPISIKKKISIQIKPPKSLAPEVVSEIKKYAETDAPCTEIAKVVSHVTGQEVSRYLVSKTLNRTKKTPLPAKEKHVKVLPEDCPEITQLPPNVTYKSANLTRGAHFIYRETGQNPKYSSVAKYSKTRDKFIEILKYLRDNNLKQEWFSQNSEYVSLFLLS